MFPNTVDPSGASSRKQSIADSPEQTEERRNAAPMTFFLRRGSDIPNVQDDAKQSPPHRASPPRSAKGIGSENWISASSEDGPGLPRRRSTIKASSPLRSRRGSSTHSATVSTCQDDSLTPLRLPSRDVSLPSSPKSISSRSASKSVDESGSEENKSQAIISSDDEEGPVDSTIQDSAPQLIMPSINVPSRRPFTAGGRRLGRYKILVAGCAGSGKTSLIKSIVQMCEDIVHVDPFPPILGANTSTSVEFASANAQSSFEIHASTKPYPSWWSDLDESRILRRRKSMGDAVLERNICFVEAARSSKVDRAIDYIEQQLNRALMSCSLSNNDFAGLLSGRGGSQVDVVLYLVSQDTLQSDIERIRRLSEITNVVPLLAKADLLSPEEIQLIKRGGTEILSSIPKLPVFESTSPTMEIRRASAPFTVSAATGPDNETMDASLLMSPEYVQPLMPSELNILIDQMFDADVMAFLRHTAAKKLISWHLNHPRMITEPSPSTSSAPNQSALASPSVLPSSLSNSGVLIPPSSEISLTTSNSYALARVADHTQREERLAQVRLSKWATDLQFSLQRERERYEKLARQERAVWLLERMGEEVRDGQVIRMDGSQMLVKREAVATWPPQRAYNTHDPLGLLRWQDAMRTRGWIALQVVGGFGVVGGLAFWLAKSLGFTQSLHEWAQEWSGNWFGMSE